MQVQGPRLGPDPVTQAQPPKATVQPYEFLQDVFNSGIVPENTRIDNKVVTLDTARRAESKLIKEFATFLRDNLPETYAQQKSQLHQLIDLGKILNLGDLFTLKSSVSHLRDQIADILTSIRTIDLDQLKQKTEQIKKPKDFELLFDIVLVKQNVNNPNPTKEELFKIVTIMQQLFANGELDKALLLIRSFKSRHLKKSLSSLFIGIPIKTDILEKAAANAKHLSPPDKKMILKFVSNRFWEKGEIERAFALMIELPQSQKRDECLEFMVERAIKAARLDQALAFMQQAPFLVPVYVPIICNQYLALGENDKAQEMSKSFAPFLGEVKINEAMATKQTISEALDQLKQLPPSDEKDTKLVTLIREQLLPDSGTNYVDLALSAANELSDDAEHKEVVYNAIAIFLAKRGELDRALTLVNDQNISRSNPQYELLQRIYLEFIKEGRIDKVTDSIDNFDDEGRANISSDVIISLMESNQYDQAIELTKFLPRDLQITLLSEIFSRLFRTDDPFFSSAKFNQFPDKIRLEVIDEIRSFLWSMSSHDRTMLVFNLSKLPENEQKPFLELMLSAMFFNDENPEKVFIFSSKFSSVEERNRYRLPIIQKLLERDPKEAIALAKTVSESNERESLLATITRFFVGNNQIERALELVPGISATNKDKFLCIIGAGYISRRHNLEEALAILNKIEEPNSRDVVLSAISQEYSLRKDIDQALNYAGQIVKNDQVCRNAYDEIVPLLMNRGKANLALELIQNHPVRAATCRSLMEDFLYKSDFPNALIAANLSDNADMRDDDLRSITEALCGKKRFEEAIDVTKLIKQGWYKLNALTNIFNKSIESGDYLNAYLVIENLPDDQKPAFTARLNVFKKERQL